jgi:arabinose-5-phosphate isomerase
MVGSDDVFAALSNSGETELNNLVPAIKKLGCTVIAFTGNTASTLASFSDIVIDVGVAEEGCPLGLAPMASTTALLAVGDALAAVLIKKREFKSSDFKKFHPGGALGQRLASEVSDIMLTGDAVPLVFDDATVEMAVQEINRPNLGVTFVTDRKDVLVGLISDGDLRRCIAAKQPIYELSVRDIMTTDPLTAHPDTPAYDALYTMEQHEITVLPIVDPAGKVMGILHLHDILGKGQFRFNGSYGG